MRRLSPVLLLVFAALLLAAAGCGGADESDEESATPAEAVEEIAEIKTMLASAVPRSAGDADAAEETVGDAYLEHFEHVEGPLGERNHDLMEELEEAISTELRNAIKAGKPPTRSRPSVDEIETTSIRP